MVDLSDPPQYQLSRLTDLEQKTGKRQQVSSLLTKLTGYELKITRGPGVAIRERLVRERRPLWRNRTEPVFEIEGHWYKLVAPDEASSSEIEVTPAAVRRLIAHCSTQLREAANPEIVLGQWLQRGEIFWYHVIKQAKERQDLTGLAGTAPLRIEAQDVTLRIQKCPEPDF